MTAAPEHVAVPDLAALLARVIDMPGMHTRALDALLTISRVEWSEEVATACIECTERPRLLLNPAFVQTWCNTPERLTMLVLHELSHVMLGHTQLFPRPTPLHNVAFDAIVNRAVLAMLEAGGVPVHPFAALPATFYRPDRMPEFLLRPPPGWPEAPDWDASAGLPSRLREIHATLYGPSSRSAGLLGVTYGEIMEALRTPTDGDGSSTDGSVALLGAHGTTPLEQQVLAGPRDSSVMDVVGGVVDALRGLLPGGGGELTTAQVRVANRTPSLERALRALFRTAAFANGPTPQRTEWIRRDVAVVHRLHDRRASSRVHAARRLGAPAPMLFAGHVFDRRPEPRGVTIYVDVSGSMADVLPHLRRALLALQHEIRPTLFWFSTMVVPAAADDLRTGRMPTTGGTSISAVLTHVTQQVKAGTPAVVLTDGFIETVSPTLINRLAAHRTPIHLGVIGSGRLHDNERWVTSAVRLPSHHTSR